MGDKVTENRLRRMAERQGLTLRKSRRRDPRALDYDTWMVSDAKSGVLDQRVDQRGGLSLADVQALLNGDYDRPRPKVKK